MTSPNTIIADMQLVETNLRQQIAHLNDEIAGLKSDVAYIKKQRDDLLESLEMISGFTFSQFMGPHDMAIYCVTAARASINRIKGDY